MKSPRNLALMFVVPGLIACAISISYAAAREPEGASIFRGKCSMCHGIDGKGIAAIRTPNFTDPKWQSAHTNEELLEAVENGVQGTAMASFKGKLSEQQMKDVLQYIRSLGVKKKK